MAPLSGVRSRLRLLSPGEINPVLIKELRARFRGRRAFVVLTAFLSLLVGIALLVYGQQTAGIRSSGPFGFQRQAADVGRAIFNTIVVTEFVFVAFAGPALTIGALSGEIERKTYELLLATPLSGWRILWGKVGAALAYVVLLVLSALPVLSLAFVFGGVSATDVVQSQLSVLVAGLLFLAIGLFNSAVLRRTTRAAVVSYLEVVLINLLPLIGFHLLTTVFDVFITPGARSVLEPLLEDLVPDLVPMVIALSPGFGLLAPIVFDSILLSFDANLFWLQSASIQLWLVVLLLLVAGARIREHGRAIARPLLALVVLLWAWTAWVIATAPDIF